MEMPTGEFGVRLSADAARNVIGRLKDLRKWTSSQDLDDALTDIIEILTPPADDAKTETPWTNKTVPRDAWFVECATGRLVRPLEIDRRYVTFGMRDRVYAGLTIHCVSFQELLEKWKWVADDDPITHVCSVEAVEQWREYKRLHR